jgi:hypothetical protein
MQGVQAATVTAFIATIEGKCREARFPDDVIELICAYLADPGERTVEDVRAAWRAHRWRY